MTDWAIWLVLAGGLLGAELFTGTFYLLMIALGLVAGAVAAWCGLVLEWQLLVAAVVGVAAVLGLRRSPYGRLRRSSANDDPNLLLDIGQSVEVPAWQVHGNQFMARVPYRGAQWDVELLPGHHASPGSFVIREIRGSRLLVAPRGSASSFPPPFRFQENFMLGSVTLVIFFLAIVFVVQTVKVVPQQHAWVVERLGKYHATLAPGLNIVVPFIDRVAYKHILKEIPLDVPPQVCITKDNTQLQVDGILYFQITDPMRASYGSSNYIAAITQLAQTTLRSVIGKMELDKTFEERDHINTAIVSAIDESAENWGVKVLRYEIKDLTPPKEILHAMQAQITAEREKRALIAASEGRKQEQINIATGEREAAIARSEGEKQASINRAEGQAAAILAIAEASAEAIRKTAAAIEQPGGSDAVNLKVAEQYVDAFGKLAKTNNSIIVPANLADMSGLIASALQVVKQQK